MMGWRTVRVRGFLVRRKKAGVWEVLDTLAPTRGQDMRVLRTFRTRREAVKWAQL